MNIVNIAIQTGACMAMDAPLERMSLACMQVYTVRNLSIKYHFWFIHPHELNESRRSPNYHDMSYGRKKLKL